MDVKAWMREALMTGLFALDNDVTAAELARAAALALHFPPERMREAQEVAQELVDVLRSRPPQEPARKRAPRMPGRERQPHRDVHQETEPVASAPSMPATGAVLLERWVAQWEPLVPDYARVLRDARWFFGGCRYLDPWCHEQRRCSLVAPLRWQLEANWLKQLPNWGRQPTSAEVEGARQRLSATLLKVAWQIEVRKRSAPEAARCQMCGGPFGAWAWYGVNVRGDPSWRETVDLCATCFEALPAQTKWRERKIARAVLGSRR